MPGSWVLTSSTLRASEVAALQYASARVPFYCRLFRQISKDLRVMSKHSHFAGVHGRYTVFSGRKVVRQAHSLASKLEPGTAGPLWAQGLAWQSRKVGLTGPTCKHSRGLVDGCTDPPSPAWIFYFPTFPFQPSAL